MIRTLPLALFIVLYSLVGMAQEATEEPIKASDIKTLPTAPQTHDGFEGKSQVAFSPPPIKNFSAEMLKKATKKPMAKTIKKTTSKKSVKAVKKKTTKKSKKTAKKSKAKRKSSEAPKKGKK